eukprot:GHVS01017946.1.p1 GENE.GHVS01017946.1~~GHVS01017946.1.p1  ORF type:complete len:138 (-),score=17.60 GHVS01017946.1:261-674(-)
MKPAADGAMLITVEGIIDMIMVKGPEISRFVDTILVVRDSSAEFGYRIRSLTSASATIQTEDSADLWHRLGVRVSGGIVSEHQSLKQEIGGRWSVGEVVTDVFQNKGRKDGNEAMADERNVRSFARANFEMWMSKDV